MLVQERVALYGSDELLPKRLRLRAGPLSFELIGGRFGPIYANGHEVWHGVAFLFRDANWGTPEPVLEVINYQVEGEGFILSLGGYIPCGLSEASGNSDKSIAIRLMIQVNGTADGCLSFTSEATPLYEMSCNRCGWVLMHPMSAAGCAVKVAHDDGRTTTSTLPLEVPAWPPFTAIRSLSHEYALGYWAEAILPGEDYELEDQRNNADASFKTYSRSNSMPRPYLLREGKKWRRNVYLRLIGGAPVNPPSVGKPSLRCMSKRDSLLGVQFGLSVIPEMTFKPSDQLLKILAEWKPKFLHLTLWSSKLDDVDWMGIRVLLDAAGASLRLDLCHTDGLGYGGEADFVCHSLADKLVLANVMPASIAAFPCGERAAEFLRLLFPSSAVGGGTPHFFAQLNRLEVSGGEDFMCFTVCPIVHCADDESVMKGLKSLPSMIETARKRHPNRNWHLGPSRISARASPLGCQPISDGLKRIPLASHDPRSRGLFGAAWLLGHIALAIQAKVNALTLPSLIGEDGLLLNINEEWHITPTAAMLQIFMSWDGLEEVMFEVEGCLAAIDPTSSLVAIVGRKGEDKHVLIANLSAQDQRVPSIYSISSARHAVLDAQSWIHHQESPTISPWRILAECPSNLVLSPYGLIHICLPLS